MASRTTSPENLRRNVAAASKCFFDHKDFIRRVISLHVHNENKADDLFQGFFLSLVSKPLPREMRNIKSYLYRAITHDIVDAIHRDAKYLSCIDRYANGVDRCPQETPKDTLSELEEARRLLELIERWLPPTIAQAIRLEYCYGYRTKEIAEKMGVGIGTIRGYLSEGLTIMRRLFEDTESGAVG